jgi:hypothetical protein
LSSLGAPLAGGKLDPNRDLFLGRVIEEEWDFPAIHGYHGFSLNCADYFFLIKIIQIFMSVDISECSYAFISEVDLVLRGQYPDRSQDLGLNRCFDSAKAESM